jgi:hypothetical protein
MRRPWVLAAVVMVWAFNSVLFARLGTVVTRDGTTFDGDVTEDQASGTVTIVVRGISSQLKKANIQSIVYADAVAADVNAKAAALPPDDVKDRLELAQYAMDHHANSAARNVLLGAQRIAPGNSDVRDMLERVNAQIRSETPVVVAQTQPTTAPATVVDLTPATAPSTTPAPTRTVTLDEINFIRQAELRDNDNVRVRIDTDLRKRFTDYVNMPLADFSAMPPIQQAFMILDKGKKQMRRDVKILSDPAAIIQYRRDVQRTLIVGCATSKCHGGSNAGTFKLFPQDTPAAAYTNFLVLQQTMVPSNGRRVSLIDRQSPDQSVLLGYMLPPATSDMPHPPATGYHGAVRNHLDTRYGQTLTWIRDGLTPLAPDYSGIDLTHPPATQPSAEPQ